MLTPTILVLGEYPADALAKLSGQFPVYRLNRADPGLVTPELARTTRGIATIVPLRASFMDSLPHLEIIAIFGVGYDHVDIAHARARGIVVTNTPGVLDEEVADAAIGLLLNTVRELPRAETWLRAGKWQSEGSYPLTRWTLRGRKAGIFGLGGIGRAIARRLEAFGLPVSYHNRRPLPDVNYRYVPSLLQLAAQVDILISAVPGGASTDRAINTEVLEALGSSGVIVNIGRGSTVDEVALVKALERGAIAAAGLDVYVAEPKVSARLLALPNVSLLPHVASASRTARSAVGDLVLSNLASWFNNGQAVTPAGESTCAKISGVPFGT